MYVHESRNMKSNWFCVIVRDRNNPFYNVSLPDLSFPQRQQTCGLGPLNFVGTAIYFTYYFRDSFQPWRLKISKTCPELTWALTSTVTLFKTSYSRLTGNS
jgi:hypothetical protein